MASDGSGFIRGEGGLCWEWLYKRGRVAFDGSGFIRRGG